MHKLEIKIPIYNCSCHVIISDNIEKIINRYIKRKKLDVDLIEEGDEVHGYVIANGDTKNYYVFYSIESLTTTYITHEISHVIDAIFYEKGIEQNGEARAYLTGYISSQVFDLVFKKGIFINKWFNNTTEKDKRKIESINQNVNNEESN